MADATTTLGELKEAIVGVGGPVTYRECRLPAQPVPEWLDYDRWLGPAPWRPYNADMVGGWMASRDFSGGEMTNWGAHHFDIAQWGLDMDKSGPVEIIPPDRNRARSGRAAWCRRCRRRAQRATTRSASRQIRYARAAAT